MPKIVNRHIQVSLLAGIWCLLGFSQLYAQTAPEAVNDTIAICVGEPIIIDLIANDYDVDGDPLETDIISGPASPLIEYEDDGLPEGSYLIEIESDFTGTDYIIYEVCGDDDELCATAVLVIIVGGAEGCVWPGDANLDSICNVIDLLPLGLYFGQTGPGRYDDDGDWDETFCPDWDELPAYALLSNPKFADCNGDGIINSADTTVLMTNYGQVRGIYEPIAFAGGMEDPELIPGVFGDTLPAGTEVVIPIYYGSDEIPANDIYGIAFQIDYDETVIDPQSVYIHFDASWLGDVGEDLIFLQYNDTLNGVLEVSATRTNQISRAGSGHFATMGFVMEDNIAGKTTGTIYAQTTLCMEQPLAINALGTPLPTRISCDTFVIADGSQPISNPLQQVVQVYPNPANQFVLLNLADITGTKQIQLQTVTGQVVYQITTSATQAEIPVSAYASGSYLLQVVTTQNIYTQQLIIQH
jgi:hypothetical protein